MFNWYMLHMSIRIIVLSRYTTVMSRGGGDDADVTVRLLNKMAFQHL